MTTLWLAIQAVRRAPQRLVLGAIGIAFPVAILAATLFFIDDAGRSMTAVALKPVQIEMRGVATSFAVDAEKLAGKLSKVPGVTRADAFASADVVVEVPGRSGKWTARLFAVDPQYLRGRSWLADDSAQLERGALLDLSLREAPGFGEAKEVAISLPGDAPALDVRVPVAGTTDLRRATPWYSIAYGEVKGDVVKVPRALVVDYATFVRGIQPVVQQWASSGGIAPVDPGSSDLPPVGIEVHVGVDHRSYPSDPGSAVKWSEQLRHALEKQAEGLALVGDNAAETLASSQADATNAKILFLLLGIPGALTAGALGLASASALAEAHRREEALLRLRGATRRQVGRIAAAHAGLAGIVGSVLGLVAGAGAVQLVTGRAVWSGPSTSKLLVSTALALAAGVLMTVLRLLRARRAGRRAEVVAERRLLERGWMPTWRRARLDAVAVGVGALILGVTALTGGLSPNVVEGPAVALSFYVLLAPIALWLGSTLLIVRGSLGVLGRIASVDRARPLSSWGAASVRWLGRRPARTGVALVLGALAVAFGTEVLAFAATYRTAQHADAAAAVGSDMRITPGDPAYQVPPLGPDVAALSPFRLVPARAGSDRKTVLMLDLGTYGAVSTVAPHIVKGEGPAALVRDPLGVLVSIEIAKDFQAGPGDTIPLTVYPDDFENSTSLRLHVVGVYRSFPPTTPPPDTPPELVLSTRAFSRSTAVPPDFYLARVAPGRSEAVAKKLRKGPLADRFAVTTQSEQNVRGLTALNLDGLGRIESMGGALVAAVGVAVLGAFLVLERRREFAILRTAGATMRQVLTGPSQEGSIAVVGSLAIGVPLGLLLGVLTVRILGLFFTLPPPLVIVPFGSIGFMVALVLVASGLALAVALRAVSRTSVASELRGQ